MIDSPLGGGGLRRRDAGSGHLAPAPPSPASTAPAPRAGTVDRDGEARLDPLGETSPAHGSEDVPPDQLRLFS